MFSEKEKQLLASISRDALSAAVNQQPYSSPIPDDANLQLHCGCFVTLKTKGNLRGCIGCFSSDRPIYETVANYTRISALEDPRFSKNRIMPAELPLVEMDVSVLTPLAECKNPEGISLGIDGIYVQKGMRSGCFLPQVATETGWNVGEFWGHCCRDKAGLPWDAWKQPDVVCQTFTAEIIDC
jgi:uncharacterized protein, PH0010 family